MPFLQRHTPVLAWLRYGACLALIALLSACGFTLRGATPLPFDSLYVGAPDNTQFGADIRRALRAASPHTQLVLKPSDAQAIFQQVADERILREVSLNAQGRVESYELGINYIFRLIDAKGNALIPDTALSVSLEMPYNDQLMQAKQGQIETLYKSMQRELVARILRRLTAPEVRNAFEHPGSEAINAPVYNPAAPIPKSTPAPWRVPSTVDRVDTR